MTDNESLRGITGILRPFKEYLQELKLGAGDQVVYYGCVGTCTPFVDLLAVTIRGLKLEQVFVPLLDESKAKIIQNVDDVGMQVSAAPAKLHPNVLVIMGGLAMPYMPVTPEQVLDLAARHGDAKIVGVCFMSMFKKSGWLEKIQFDLMIDATIDPVQVTRREISGS